MCLPPINLKKPHHTNTDALKPTVKCFPFSSFLFSAGDAAEVMSLLMSGAREVLHAEAAAAGLRRDGTIVFDEYLHHGKVMKLNRSIRPGQGMPPVLEGVIKIRSLICAPVVAPGESILMGHIELYNKQGARDFSEEDALLLRHAASSAALSLERLVCLKVEKDLRKNDERMQQMGYGAVTAVTRLVEKRDPYTAGHQRRVAQLAHAIAVELGLPENRATGIRVGGLIHDVGKMNVPAEILSKPGKLNSFEYDIIKTHPDAGYDILRTIDFPWPIADIAHQHQERLDGSGYPRGLKDGQILLETKIVSVADVVEAMTFHRPYRQELGLAKALEEIEGNKGICYCDRAVDVCLKLFRENRFVFKK